MQVAQDDTVFVEWERKNYGFVGFRRATLLHTRTSFRLALSLSQRLRTLRTYLSFATRVLGLTLLSSTMEDTISDLRP